MTASPSSSALRRIALVTCALSPFWIAGCSSGAGGGGMEGTEGELLDKPDGSGLFFNDANDGGSASKVKLLDVSWGRLVDVHDIEEPSGDVDPSPVFRDFVINETIQSDGLNYELETNPVTQRTRLIVLREFQPGDPADEFVPLLQQAADDLSPIQAKSDKPGTLPPFSFVARNCAIVLRFNDLLDDSMQKVLTLPEDVQVLTDYPPSLPYQNRRMLFDPNHGGLSGGAFHSTRVLIDLTVSESEATSMPVPTGLNSLGLPPSITTTQQANVSVRIPTLVDPSVGQFSRLTNLAKHGLATSDNGPVDFASKTLDVVRAMRSGNSTDENNGFLLDLNPPELVSGWPIIVLDAVQDPAGEAGFDFLLDVQFTTPCRAQPVEGNIIELPGAFTEVAAIGLPPDSQGKVTGLEVRVLGESMLSPSALLGGALFKRTFQPALLPISLQGCWLSFAPLPGVFPADSVQPNSQVVLRFSEPMDPATVSPFDTFRVKRLQGDPSPSEIVVGEVAPSSDLKEFTFTPLLPFDHTLGSTESYFVNLVGTDGITDLAGNAPVGLPDSVEFRLNSAAPTVRNGGLVLTFDSFDEVKHPTLYLGADPEWPDWRGQFLYDPERDLYKPRPLVRSAAIADRSQAVPGIMIPFAPGVQTPLAPLGSKLMTVWRYCDVGFSSQDETNYNMDIEGLNWSPIGAQIVSDFYPEFEIRLAHSFYQPDEHLDPTSGLPDYPDSGLKKTTFNTNILSDPASPQKIVHSRDLGYVLNPVDLFLSSTGTFMMPYPLNRNTPPSEDVYYTWRDTAIQAKAAPSGIGIDLKIMEDVGLIPPPPEDPEAQPSPNEAGAIAMQGQVPSLGLPLLMEFRTYPAEEGVGLNAFDISLAINTSRIPAFRVFSTGGLNQSGILVTKDPDLETVPTGGFNPNSPTPGAPTPPDDCSFYIGQMDVITRISRMHSIWLDTTQAGNVTDFLDPIVEPIPEQQPAGTQLVFAFRGASAISGESLQVGKGYAFRADHIDPYGDVRDFDETTDPDVIEFIGSLNDVSFFPAADKTWKNDIDALDQARYFQMRVTFVGNTTTLLNPEFSAVGVAWVVND